MSRRAGKTKASARRPAARRPRVGAWWRQRWARAGALGMLAAGLAGGALWSWQAGWTPRLLDDTRAAATDLSVRTGLEVREVLVQGRRETARAALLGALGTRRGAPILAFDPDAARTRVEALPWVRRATVQRLLPDTLVVLLEERSPLALWQRDGRFTVIDDTGEEIPGVPPQRFADLLVVVGPDAPPHAAGLLQVIGSQPSLMARVRAAVRVGGRRWNLRLDNGVDVQLPERAPTVAWARLADYEKEHGVLDRDVRAVDLRLPDRLVLRRGREAVEPPPGRNT